ncbi:tetratricopeptide repeat protein [Cellulophaga sp. F20128]|uniref:tetratricopeptide repeat protein n=1 Tax=Cellulophaga sp. F20128 TaxID=2926413 RepID=UPI001FF3C715|nr:tetratricopeptide repeat protein [Cellulophaga sp. F20128]MCK0157618.1 tetratricopeptide repeat protein [Cellulophaga sp. F20128]
MATYKKRGYKPKTKEEEVELQEQESTTAEVFNTLDEGASKTEEWVAGNQKAILGVIGVIAIGVLGYLAYVSFVQNPKTEAANNEMYYPQQYFDEALNNAAVNKDSLFNLALNGSEGKYGFLDIIQEYKGTKTANLASYSAGMAYLNMKNYQEAINHLEDFSSDNVTLGALAKGGIGDAFMQLNQTKDALGYYEKAISQGENGFTTPRFLHKAGVAALELGENAKALKFFQRIKDDYPSSQEASTIDVFIGKAKQ